MQVFHPARAVRCADGRLRRAAPSPSVQAEHPSARGQITRAERAFPNRRGCSRREGRSARRGGDGGGGRGGAWKIGFFYLFPELN